MADLGDVPDPPQDAVRDPRSAAGAPSDLGGGPVGLSTLAVALGEEPETLEDVYEPYLLQLGFLHRTPRGRVVTDLGRAHVGEHSGDRLF